MPGKGELRVALRHLRPLAEGLQAEYEREVGRRYTAGVTTESETAFAAGMARGVSDLMAFLEDQVERMEGDEDG